MAATWGTGFLTQYGESPNPAWADRLSEFTQEQLMAGYRRAVDAGSDYPPNLSTMVDFVRHDPDWEHRRLSKELPPLAIEDKGARERRIEQGKREMANIMQMFEGNL